MVRKGFFKRFYHDRQLYMFMILPVAYIIIFEYAPMLGLQIAFKNFQPRLGIWGSEWVGFDNFTKFFGSYQFRRIVPNTLILSVMSIAASFPIPILYALILNSLPTPRFKKISTTITNMPHFISTVVLVGILMQVFNSRTGLYGTVAMQLTGAYPKDLFSSPSNFRHLYVWSGVWQNFGWNSIIYTAALAAVSPDLHEAAEIDGASRLQRVFHIDLPCIVPTIIIMLILKAGSVMSIGFEKVFLMQNTLNKSASQVISTYVYETGLRAQGVRDYSYATAIGMFNSIINLFLIATVNKIADRSGNSLW